MYAIPDSAGRFWTDLYMVMHDKLRLKAVVAPPAVSFSTSKENPDLGRGFS